MLVEPYLFVIVGGTGDLTQRKLLPAFYRLITHGDMIDRGVVLGAARTELDDERYRAEMRAALERAEIDPAEGGAWCDHHLYYQTIPNGTAEDYVALADRIEEIERERDLPGNRVFYLALPPSVFESTIEALGEAGLNKSEGWTRIVVEKPFGRSLETARALNELLHRWFAESQIYRIDHYLGKETVQNLIAFRFANPIFEAIWNRDHVERVEIMVAEKLGVEDRAGYYEHAGALRDMVQNHLTQLLTLIAMEVPGRIDAGSLRFEKVKVLRALELIGADDIVLGQYADGEIDGEQVPGYREEKGVAPDSTTETFAALRLKIANWRWQGVPFFLRTGKRLAERLTQIAVIFRRPPVRLFGPSAGDKIHSNVLLITLQPNEGFSLAFEVKIPGDEYRLRREQLTFSYQEAFGPLPEAYETLLLEILTGDQTLFVHADEVEASWAVYMPILEAKPKPHDYPAGSWGPEAACELLGRRREADYTLPLPTDGDGKARKPEGGE